jgi:hypothetical protein
MSYAKTSHILNNLKIVRDNLIELKGEFIKEIDVFDDSIEYINNIDAQLIFVNKNIRTFENALLIHESKVLEKRPSLGDLSTISLN